MAKGAKTRGGHMEAEKVNEEIAKIRNVEPYKTINSPNRYEFIHNAEDLNPFRSVAAIRSKTIGFKIVVTKFQKLKHSHNVRWWN